MCVPVYTSAVMFAVNCWTSKMSLNQIKANKEVTFLEQSAQQFVVHTWKTKSNWYIVKVTVQKVCILFYIFVRAFVIFQLYMVPTHIQQAKEAPNAKGNILVATLKAVDTIGNSSK